MLEKTRVKIEAFKMVVGCNWFGKKECRENKISPETLVKNVPELIVDKEIITCEVSEVEYLETIEKYGDRMDSKGFGVLVIIGLKMANIIIKDAQLDINFLNKKKTARNSRFSICLS